MSKKYHWMLVVAFLASQMAFTVGCDEDSSEAEVDMLADVMETVEGYVDDNDIPPVLSAETIHTEVIVGGSDDYQLIDVRPADQFEGAHIEGAVNLPYGAGWELDETLEQLDMDKTIVLICNTGHKASFLTLYLVQLGYDAYTMKFGMMGWNSSEEYNGIPTTFCSEGAGAGEFATDAETVATETFDALEILSDATVDELIMELAGDYWAEGNSPVVKNADVNTAVTEGDDSYQIVDIRAGEHYDADHIPGAINVSYGAFINSDALVNLDPSKKLVIVCYTGHTASQITMLLNELGYEAYSMAYGMMGWHSDNPGSPCDAVQDYPVVLP